MMWRSAVAGWVSALVLSACLPAYAASAEDDDLPTLGKAGDFSLKPPEVADGGASGWYLRADAGYVAPAGGAVSAGPFPLTGDLSGAGWSVGAGIGYRLLPFLRAEASLDYLDLGSASGLAGRVGADALVGLASLYWDVITVAGFTPYVGAGAGFAVTSFDLPSAFTAARTDWGFAFALAAGVSYAFSEALSLDLGYRYVNLGARDLSVLAPLETGTITAHQIRLGLRYALE